MSDNWVVQNLENALNTWNEKLAEIWQLITQSPENFKGGTIWNVIVDIHGAVQAIGLALLVLFFVVGVMRTCGNFADVNFCQRTYTTEYGFIRWQALATIREKNGYMQVLFFFKKSEHSVQNRLSARAVR